MTDDPGSNTPLIKLVCSTCAGQGEVAGYEGSWYEPESGPAEQCRDCNGSGYVEERHAPGMTELLGCPACEGTGEIDALPIHWAMFNLRSMFLAGLAAGGRP